MLNVVLAQCREGFEPETAADLDGLARAAGVDLDGKIVPRSGFVAATVQGAAAQRLSQWTAAHRAAPSVFARSIFHGTGPLRIAPIETRAGRVDRVTPLAEAIATLCGERTSGTLWIEHPDTNEGKQLSTLARALEPRLAGRLRELGVLAPGDAGRARLHVFLPDGATAFIGLSDPVVGARWPMGVPRLRVPPGAPSRSARKLAEALVTFLGDDEPEVMRPGMRAVDLGAAPGGWSWLLAQRGVRVTAVDNGPLKGEAAADPLVTHVRADGLHYRPRRSVDWVTCDIVESPSRIATLMAAWIAEGAARRAIFNLKLPMKRRYEEVQRCRDIIDATLRRNQVAATLALRQLYHDREEVTAWLAR